LQIIPENDRLIIEARIRTTDIDQVHIGQEASIRLSAFDSRTTPMLKGKVMKVSGAQYIDPDSHMPYYTVNVEIPESELALLGKKQKLIPGMPAEVYLRTSERTPFDYLIKPLRDQFMRAFKES
jgi:multidrug efflux pump subunit AcrA (membrane-fusion protein)